MNCGRCGDNYNLWDIIKKYFFNIPYLFNSGCDCLHNGINFCNQCEHSNDCKDFSEDL